MGINSSEPSQDQPSHTEAGSSNPGPTFPLPSTPGPVAGAPGLGPGSDVTPIPIDATGIDAADDVDSEKKEHCPVVGCKFQSKTKQGIREHEKNMHLGTVCYWPLSNGGFCGTEASSHAALYEHFNSVHLQNKDAGEDGLYECHWPGGVAGILPTGMPIEKEKPCSKKFVKVSSAERHARSHQHKIWRKVEEYKRQ